MTIISLLIDPMKRKISFTGSRELWRSSPTVVVGSVLMATPALRIQTLLLSMSSSIGTGGRTVCRICRKLAQILPVSYTFLPVMYSHQTNICSMRTKHVIFDASTNIFTWMEAIGLFEAGQILLRHWWVWGVLSHPMIQVYLGNEKSIGHQLLLLIHLSLLIHFLSCSTVGLLPPPGADLRLFSGAQHLHHPEAHPAVVGGQEHDCGLPTLQQLPLLCLCYVPCTIHNKNTDYFVTVDPQRHQVQRLHWPISWATHFHSTVMFHRKAFLHFVTPEKAWTRRGVH